MLGIFRPKAPLDLKEKVWTESRFAWLLRHFGVQRLRDAKEILPSREFFPDEFEQTEESVQNLYGQMCKYMGVSPTSVPLQVVQADAAPEETGASCSTGGCCGVTIEPEQIDEEIQTATMFGRELSAQLLATNSGVEELGPEAPYMGELLLVMLGLGAFPAIVSNPKLGTRLDWNRWSMTQMGMMPARAVGYAMALRYWIRDESPNVVLPFVGLDVRTALTKGLKFLQKTGDSVVTPDNAHRVGSEPSVGQLIDQLRDDSATQRLSAAWLLADRGTVPRDAIHNLSEGLTDNEAGVRAAAIQALGRVEDSSHAPVDAMIDCLRDRSPDVRSAAAVVLSGWSVDLNRQSPSGDIFIDGLSEMMQGQNTNARLAAGMSLAKYGDAAASLADTYLAPLKKSLVQCSFGETQLLIQALQAIIPDVESFLNSNWSLNDSDILHLAREALEDLKPAEERLSA